MAVSAKTEPSFSMVGIPQILFRGTYILQGPFGEGTPWDISTDGKRFLMMKMPASTGTESMAAGPRKFIIVLNWFEELKERVPVE
jgi:hypothetical protein